MGLEHMTVASYLAICLFRHIKGGRGQPCRPVPVSHVWHMVFGSAHVRGTPLCVSSLGLRSSQWLTCLPALPWRLRETTVKHNYGLVWRENMRLRGNAGARGSLVGPVCAFDLLNLPEQFSRLSKLVGAVY
ncbi:hypothetical protein DPX16_7390 [Anabarilius grahami]|uniref:Uncharacterized protein n=1 Tax=Anabarilius grahami TaxID=495550 RepID=A0A3N0Z3A7_ANAGA|nr:hypothetical protein DPX16_7390 [Anabarilius grahami]